MNKVTLLSTVHVLGTQVFTADAEGLFQPCLSRAHHPSLQTAGRPCGRLVALPFGNDRRVQCTVAKGWRRERARIHGHRDHVSVETEPEVGPTVHRRNLPTLANGRGGGPQVEPRRGLQTGRVAPRQHLVGLQSLQIGLAAFAVLKHLRSGRGEERSTVHGSMQVPTGVEIQSGALSSVPSGTARPPRLAVAETAGSRLERTITVERPQSVDVIAFVGREPGRSCGVQRGPSPGSANVKQPLRKRRRWACPSSAEVSNTTTEELNATSWARA